MIQATEKPRKILFLITKATWGGAQKYVFDLATHVSIDWSPVVAYGQSGPLSEQLTKHAVRTIALPALRRDISLFFDIASCIGIAKLFRAEKPDVVHVNSSKAAALGVFAARLTGVPRIVFTAHGWPFKENRGPVATALIYLLSWWTALFSHVVIVISKEDQEIGKRMWFVGKKIQYIPLALNERDLDMYSREQASEILFQDISESFRTRVRLVSIAELTPNKGLRYGIDMMAELEKRSPGKYRYAIIGVGEERSALADYAERLNIASCLHFFSFGPNHDALTMRASQFLKAFDIFVLPSIKEGMPYVLLEASAAGLPIVATNVVQNEAAHIPHIRFVTPGTGSELADAVEKVSEQLSPVTPTTSGSFFAMIENTLAVYDH